jgi:hypothetical protein
MYTNIDTNHALSEIQQFLNTTEFAQQAGISTNAVLKALQIVMRNNIFKFNDTNWLQLSGTAMGTPSAPSYATMYYAIHELKIIKLYPKQNYYGRYLDDGHGIWTPFVQITTNYVGLLFKNMSKTMVNKIGNLLRNQLQLILIFASKRAYMKKH